MTDITAAARLGALYALVRPASDVADHWVQSDYQAVTKDKPGREGRAACAAHVLSYVGTQAAVVAVGARVLGIRITPGRAAAALAVSAVTHYIADRREPLRRCADAVARLQGEKDGSAFVRMTSHGINGANKLDQAWHHAAELLAVAILATGPAARD